MLSLIVAIVAILVQPTPPPAEFAAGLGSSYEVEQGGIIGRAWSCGDEECYAALDLTTGEFVTGP